MAEIGKVFDLDELLEDIIANLEIYFKILAQNEFDSLIEQYEGLLFRKDKPSTFKDSKGNLFSGFIKNISPSGSLNVLLEDDIVKEFDLKELTLLY